MKSELEKVFTGAFLVETHEHTFLHMSDKKHEFVVPLSDLLQCLSFAQECKEIPEIQKEWWEGVASTYKNPLSK